MAAWQDEYLAKGLLMHFKSASYNNTWNYYYGYTHNQVMADLRKLAGNGEQHSNRYGYTNNSIQVNRENVHKVVQYVLERSGNDNPNMYSQHCYNMRHQMRKLTKPYMHQLVYKERKVKYNEMVLEMDNGSTESNS